MQTNNNSTETPTPSGISRRTVVKGAAWAVPAIAVAGAVPAMAASQCNVFTFGPASCKTSGEDYYILQICLTSTCPGNVFPLTVTRIATNNGRWLTETPWTGPNSPGSTLTTAVFNGNGCVVVDGYSFGSASTLTLEYTQADGSKGTYELMAPPTQGGCALPTTTTTTTVAVTAAEVTTTTTTAAEVTTTTTTAAA